MGELGLPTAPVVSFTGMPPLVRAFLVSCMTLAALRKRGRPAWRISAQAAARYTSVYIVCSSCAPVIDVGKRSAEYNSTGDFVSLRHQCAVVLVSVVTSPGLWTIGTEQLLAYSTIVPLVMTMIAGRSW